MRYGKNDVAKKREKLTSSSTMVGKKAGVSALRVLFLSLIAVGFIGVCTAVGAFRGIIDNTPDISEVNIAPAGQATFIYDAEGNQVQKLTDADSGSNRISIPIDQIPLDMQHAIVAIEDERFYEHNGIDLRGILRAFVKGVTSGFNFDEGASTLTQQLLKNNVFTNWTNEGKIERFIRKFQEQFLALELEETLTAQGKDAKAVILENYLNTINLGAGAYGVQAASKRYFDKDAKDLTLSECAVLAAIPQSPTRYNPISHPEYNAERRATVLEKMLDQGYITEEAYQEALADPVYDRIQEHDSTQTDSQPYSYFTDELLSEIKEDLITLNGYTEEQATNAIYSGGLKIYSTQDPEIQAIMDEEYQNEANFPEGTQISLDWALSVTKADGTVENHSQEMLQSYYRENVDPDFDLLFDSEEEAAAYVADYKNAVLFEGDTILAERCNYIPQPQSAMVIIDQHTGYVKGIVGGRGKKTGSLTLNRATDTPHQPGSCFKILSTYGPALELDKITLATVKEDEPTTYSTGQSVRNATGTYSGDVTIRYAIAQSINTVAVQTIQQITPRVAFDYVKQLGFTTLVESENGDIVEPMALGGLTYGVTPLELTAAYAAIANGGTYIRPVLYTKVTDSNGNVLLQNTPQKTQVFKESTAYLLTSAMEDVVKSGTGTALQLDNMSVAGKTGTTNDDRSKWFAGFTPYYTAAVWGGYDSNDILPANARTFQNTLWKQIMARIHADLPNVEFTAPDSVKKVTICSSSGLLAGSGCPRATEYFDLETVPTERCTRHYVKPTPTPTPTPEAGSDDPQSTPTAEATPTPPAGNAGSPETPAHGGSSDAPPADAD